MYTARCTPSVRASTAVVTAGKWKVVPAVEEERARCAERCPGSLLRITQILEETGAERELYLRARVPFRKECENVAPSTLVISDTPR